MDQSSRLEEFIHGIGKLEGASNYLVWAFRVKLLLKLEEAWFVVEREVPSDQDGSDSWRIQEKKERAMHVFAFTLSESASMLIRNLREPAAVWAKLKTCYETRSRVLLRQSSEAFAMLPALSSPPDTSDHQDVNSSALLNTHDAELSNPSAPTEQTELQKKKNLAMVILVESVEDHIVPLIMDLDDPAEVWARLAFLFEPPSTGVPPKQRSSAAAAA